MSNDDKALPAETKVSKANIKVLGDKRTYLMGSTILLGESAIVGEDHQVKSAATNGRDKLYNKEFIKDWSLKQVTYLVLHENMHVYTMDMFLIKDLWDDDPELANAAADYYNNLMIESLPIQDMIERPPGALVNEFFRDYTKREIYRFLKTGKDKDGNSHGKPQRNKKYAVTIGGSDYSTEPMDFHDFTKAENMTPEEIQQLQQDVKQAIQQASMLAGLQGADLPLGIKGLLVPEIDWEREMEEFLVAAIRGDEDITFRKYDRRFVMDDNYMPTLYSERVGTLIVAMDTSGSTHGDVFSKFVGGLASVLQRLKPERVRILHWDVGVKHDQTIDQNSYTDGDLLDLLKPRGGGGTVVGETSKYIVDNHIEADCCLVFTDGYLESDPVWHVPMPTLWVVTECESFVPPAGRRVTIR